MVSALQVQDYWLGIMAACLAAALGVWLVLVFWAGRKSASRPQENSPHREVIGGSFEASRGGRQVMPDPTEPVVHEPAEHQPAEQEPAEHQPGAVAGASVPEQRTKREAVRQEPHGSGGR